MKTAWQHTTYGLRNYFLLNTVNDFYESWYLIISILYLKGNSAISYTSFAQEAT